MFFYYVSLLVSSSCWRDFLKLRCYMICYMMWWSRSQWNDHQREQLSVWCDLMSNWINESWYGLWYIFPFCASVKLAHVCKSQSACCYLNLCGNLHLCTWMCAVCLCVSICAGCINQAVDAHMLAEWKSKYLENDTDLINLLKLIFFNKT